jgi:two-component system, sensor histidine kinase and response regulator
MPKLLVVDDIAANRELLLEILALEGYSAVTASSGAEALRLVAKEDPELMLLDVNMPGMDGLEVCRRLRANPETRSLPIILVTALAEREQRLAGVEAGANDYLTKPIDRTELLLRVRNALGLRALHREVARQYAELQKLERMRDSLVHMLVHDLRSPLTGITGYLELSQMRVAELHEPELERDLSEARQSVAELTEMVSDVLDVSRFEAGAMPLKLVPLDLRTVAAEAIAMIGSPRHVTITYEPASHAIDLVADSTVLRRVIANLVGNAVKFSPRGSVVRVTASPNGSPGSGEVRVADQGQGIPAEYHERIFEKFGQVEGNGAGVRSSGLGLAYCKLAVEAHKGRIGVESQPGAGSTFWFVLPGVSSL